MGWEKATTGLVTQDDIIVSLCGHERILSKILYIIIQKGECIASCGQECAEPILRPALPNDIGVLITTPTPDSSVAEVVASLFTIGAARFQGLIPLAGKQLFI